ncbi:Predicted arabinose efflux permease, MFS family [Micromonospora echinaurantiaca]|uniref:Predicted arabinose efflux permease, MFS family n=1 Tax=Micromonospora echinaurantiaca TaxID=47857 RepID=A0A1C5K2X0_9ACTN|nr:MFS transporter [Micromonospora echinaurantiaca]SCG76616.1 Predicted arabinose efflux permease, MFS family [Micromonospora echinaurantiaca]
MRPLRRWLDYTAGGLPATFWYLWAGLLINRAGAFAMLFLSLYLTSARSASEAVAGAVVGAYGAGGAAGVLLGGVLADRWGRRSTLLAAHLVTAALMVALAFSRHLVVIAVLAALVGVVHSMPSPAFVAAIVDVVPEQRRSRAFNLQFWAFNLGMAVASLLAGVLAEASFVALFLVDAAATLLAAAVIAWKVPETLPSRSPRHAPILDSFRSTRTETVQDPGDGAPATTAGRGRVGPDGGPVRPGGRSRRPGLHTALTDRVFLVFVGLTFVLAVLTLQTSTIMPLAMRTDGLSPSAYGVVVALGGVLIVLGQLFVPRLIERHRKDHVLAVSTGLLALGFGALAYADDLPVYLGAAVVWTVGSMLAAPPNAQINADLAPPELRARYQSVFYLAFPAASFVAPTLGGVSLQYLGERHWLIVGGLGLLAAAGHLWAGPPRERRVAALRRAAAERPEPALTGR